MEGEDEERRAGDEEVRQKEGAQGREEDGEERKMWLSCEQKLHQRRLDAASVASQTSFIDFRVLPPLLTTFHK